MRFLQSSKTLKKILYFKTLSFIGLILVLIFYSFSGFCFDSNQPSQQQESDSDADRKINEIKLKLKGHFTESNGWSDMRSFSSQTKGNLGFKNNCSIIFPYFSKSMEVLFKGTAKGLNEVFNENTQAENKKRNWEQENAIASITPAITNCNKQLRINYVDIYDKLVASKLFVIRKKCV